MGFHIKNFACVENKGFQMRMNGYRISVMFGSGNYVEEEIRHGRSEPTQPIHTAYNAEIAIWHEGGQWLFTMDDGIINDNVIGWLDGNQVAKIIGVLANCGDGDPRHEIAQIASETNDNL
jgi:hypothetical protein